MAATNPTSNLDMQNWFATTLSVAAGSTDTTFSLTATPTPSEGYLIIDPNNTSTREVIHYTSVGTGTVTVPTLGDRGIDGGNAATTHAQGTAVVMNFTTSYWDALKNGYAVAHPFVAGGIVQASGGNPVWQYLGSYSTTSGYSTANSGQTQATNYTVTVTIPSGYTKVRVSFTAQSFYSSNAGSQANIAIWRGVVGSGTQIAGSIINAPGSNYQADGTFWGLDTPTAGSVTYNIGVNGDGTHSGVIGASSGYPAVILVECC